ncbi:MAG: permease, partial [Anaerolineaceae bacterium]|nr:permease [Anaerolineaceae bacterium]
MAAILGSLLLGITILANHIAAVPSDQETLISQLGRTVFDGRGVLYMGTILSTTVILVMAANTAFADFPRLSALHAGDGFLPRQLTFRGSRLVFSHGIMALSVIASLLIIVFQASVTRLIPLYAIGVFLSFTLSQTGMARRWWKVGHLQPGVEVKEPGSTLRYEKGWQVKMVINSIGAVCTFVVMIVFAVTKFHDGAYIVVILTPVLVSIFFAIHHHYKSLARQLSLDTPCSYNPLRRHRVIMPISGVHRGTLEALRYARTLSDDITAVHVSIDPEETERVQYKWEKRGEGIRLVVLNSPYRMFIEPLLEYIDMVVAACKNNEVVTILVPQFVPRHWWTAFLHARTADTLRKALLNHENIVITEVPYQVR